MPLVAWPLNESEAEGDLTLIETSLLFYVNDAVLMLISRSLHNKSSESPPASLSLKGQVTKHTTVKRFISELKHAMFLSHRRQLEVNISYARTVVSPRF